MLLLLDIVYSAKKARTKPCKRTAFNRHTTNYRAWREQMTVCELLDNYDPAIRPSGKSPINDQSSFIDIVISISIT
uniref:Uncharacterized protein n=1 Tax=Parascaris equorum TaxID=6256 RepID=A0A914RNH0_PAREQ